MRIEQLKYFLEVAHSGSINATAQHLFISQQGISEALKRMEQEFEELTELDKQLTQTEKVLKKMKWPLKEVFALSPKPKKEKQIAPVSQTKQSTRSKKKK